MLELDARTDYRLEKLSRAPVYFTPLGPKADAALDAAFLPLTGLERGEPMTIAVLGRRLEAPQAIEGVARFDFDALFRRRSERPTIWRSPSDFIRSWSTASRVWARPSATRRGGSTSSSTPSTTRRSADRPAAGEPEKLYSGATARRRSNSTAPSRASSNALGRLSRAAARARERISGRRTPAASPRRDRRKGV